MAMAPEGKGFDTRFDHSVVGVPPSIHAVVVDGSPNSAGAVGVLLTSEDTLDVVARATSYKEAFHLVETLQPDLLIIELEPSQLPDVDAAFDLLAMCRTLKVRVLCIVRSAAIRAFYLAAGADVVIEQSKRMEELPAALKRIQASFQAVR